jgi:predicted dehydrogenase
MEGYMFGYHPQHAIVQKLIEEDRIGEPRVIQSEFAMPWPADGNYRRQRELGGGIFLDAAGYPVAAAMLFYKGAPTSVYCRIQMDAGGMDHTASMILEFPNGQLAQTLVAYGLHYRSRYRLLGSKGTIEALRAFAVPPDMVTEIVFETGDRRETIPVAPADQFRLMIDDFCAQARNASSPSRVFEENLLRQHAVMDAAWRSHLEQRPVRLSEIG